MSVETAHGLGDPLLEATLALRRVPGIAGRIAAPTGVDAAGAVGRSSAAVRGVGAGPAAAIVGEDDTDLAAATRVLPGGFEDIAGDGAVPGPLVAGTVFVVGGGPV